jgi:hypothetical protein
LKALLDVIADEGADQVLFGWTPRRRDVVFGTTVDPILERAECEVTIVRNPREISEVVTLAGRGDNAPVAARHGAQLARASHAPLKLLNVQPAAEDEDADPGADGLETVHAVVERAGLDEDEYEPDVRVAE